MSALVVGSLLALSAAVSVPEPTPQWRLVHLEDFSGTRLPAGCGAYGPSDHAGKAASWYDPAQVGVSAGLLRLSMQRKPRGDRTYATGGVGCWSLARTFGKFEVRAKVPPGKGIDSYLILWPVDGDDLDWSGIEILAPGPDRAHLTNGDGTRKGGKVVSGPFADDFHTYTFEWTPRWLAIRIDGRQVYRSSATFRGKRWLGMAVSSGDNLTGLPDTGTQIPAEFQIDSFAIHAHSGWSTAPPTSSARRTASASAESDQAEPSASESSPAVPVAAGGSAMHIALLAAVLILPVAMAVGLIHARRRRSEG